MKSAVKKVLSIIIIAVVVFGVFVSWKGLGPIDNLKQSLKYGLDIDGGVYVVMQADTKGISKSKLKETMEQTKEVLEKRVNAMGISEATVSIEGNDRFRIEMPGVKNARTAINRIGKTAQLKFTLADGTAYLTGSDVKTASAVADDENGGYKIELQFTSEGRKKFAKVTELASSGKVTPTVTADGSTVSANSVVIWLDNDILTYPTASSKIDSKNCEITRAGGGLPESEAKQTAALIRGGSLPLSLKEVESSVQTASIGANALDKSIVAGGIGLLLVFALMIISFNLLGVFADIALTLYVLMVLWIMAAMDAVLTLPGIAGIILGIGMAVDANVIIFSRIREEIGLGRSVRMAVDIGFKHALVTVLDSQITTLIATVVLYELGSTTVKGFALTLMISIIISIFTAVFVTQVFVSLLAGMRNPNMAFFGCKPDGTPKTLIKRDFHFIEKRKIFYTISAAIIVFGLINLGIRGFNYGIDFTGGTMIQMDMGKKVSVQKVEDTVSKYNLKDLSVVYSGSGQKEVILRTTDALNANRREDVQKTLEKAFDRTERDVISSQEFGPTVGIQLRSNAIKAILIAALGMLVYIIFRFKSWKYGVAAVAGLGHDVLVLIGVYAVFGITVNNPFIAAVLTIVGYSINDTIVIFDRVRENCKVMRGVSLIEILDHSISQTMNRSILTSLTTVIAIVPLLVMVSSSLAAFVLPLMVGVICGTYSSIALCSPLYYELNKREEASKYQQREKARARIEAKKKKNAAAADTNAAAANASSNPAVSEKAGAAEESAPVKNETKNTNKTNKPKKKSSSSKNRKHSKKRK